MSNKTSDKNVVNIEEDIKYVKEMLEIARVFFKAVKAETNYKDVDDVAFCNAVEHILAEREQDKKIIQELKEENKENKKKYLALLLSQFPDTTETYKKYKKELEELLEGEK